MSYLQRYLAGEHEAVWEQLGSLRHGDCAPDVEADAEAVAVATMERVATNIDRLIERLTAHGYQFGVYPGGEPIWGYARPRIKPHGGTMPDLLALHEAVGPLPLSIRTFWQVVGEVNLQGRLAHGALPDYSDALCIDGPAIGLDFLAGRADEEEGCFLCPIAPDVLHKDKVSGGPPYAMSLPDPAFDGLILDEWHGVRFVPYLRLAILEWGGFPGLSEHNPHHEWRTGQVAPDWVNGLTDDLLPF